jgi:hypothetical protein
MKHLYLLLTLSFLSLSPLSAQDAKTDEAGGGLLNYFCQQKDSIPTLTLETNWTKLIRKKGDEAYQDGKLSFVGPGGSPVDIIIQLRARGNMRKEVCYYPPIRAKIDKKILKDMGFASFNKLKLVLSCKSGPRDENCLLREYLAYKIYEILEPDFHLRTALIKMHALQEGKERFFAYAFFVEHEDELAARLGAQVIDKGVIRVHSLERDSYAKMCFFQYMIANTDWAVNNRHNLRFVKLPEKKRLTVIPYDFDYAGFTGTDYAVPHSSLPIKSVEQRHFMGFQITRDEALETAALFLERKGLIMQLCEEFDLLDERNKKAAKKYLDGFFELLEDEKKLVKTFANAN